MKSFLISTGLVLIGAAAMAADNAPLVDWEKDPLVQTEGMTVRPGAAIPGSQAVASPRSAPTAEPGFSQVIRYRGNVVPTIASKGFSLELEIRYADRLIATSTSNPLYLSPCVDDYPCDPNDKPALIWRSGLDTPQFGTYEAKFTSRDSGETLVFRGALNLVSMSGDTAAPPPDNGFTAESLGCLANPDKTEVAASGIVLDFAPKALKGGSFTIMVDQLVDRQATIMRPIGKNIYEILPRLADAALGVGGAPAFWWRMDGMHVPGEDYGRTYGDTWAFSRVDR